MSRMKKSFVFAGLMLAVAAVLCGLAVFWRSYLRLEPLEAADTEETPVTEQIEPEEEAPPAEIQAPEEPDMPAPAEQMETLLITTTMYTNGENNADGIDLIVYSYDPDTDAVSPIFRSPTNALFPANTVDFERQIIYYADGRPGDFYDNLYACDLRTGDVQQLTDGKYRFDDLLLVDGTLYANTAREYATTCQPARFDFDTQTFTYRDEEDDDTWHHSFSYDPYTGEFLILTCSDAEMRTHRVAAETFIRPKTISLISADFQTVTPLYFTEDFEIRLTRRQDENHILMTADPYMGGGPRTLRQLSLDTQQVEEFAIPGILSVYLFYPTSDGQTLYLVAKPTEGGPAWNLYRYELEDQTLTQITLPEGTRQIADIQITRQACGPQDGLACCIIANSLGSESSAVSDESENTPLPRRSFIP